MSTSRYFSSLERERKESRFFDELEKERGEAGEERGYNGRSALGVPSRQRYAELGALGLLPVQQQSGGLLGDRASAPGTTERGPLVRTLTEDDLAPGAREQAGLLEAQGQAAAQAGPAGRPLTRSGAALALTDSLTDEIRQNREGQSRLARQQQAYNGMSDEDRARLEVLLREGLNGTAQETGPLSRAQATQALLGETPQSRTPALEARRELEAKGYDLKELLSYAQRQQARQKEQDWLARQQQAYNGMSDEDRARLEVLLREGLSGTAQETGPLSRAQATQALLGETPQSGMPALEARRELEAKGYDLKELLSYAQMLENQGRAERQSQAAAELTDEHPILANLAGIGASLTGGASSTLGMGAQTVANALTGSDAPVDINTGWGALNRFAGAVRGQTTENIQDWYDGISGKEGSAGGQALGFGYQTLMSGLDSAAALLAGPAGPALLGLSAGSQAAEEAIGRGASFEEAAAYGVTAGIFEGLFEKISLGNLRAFKELPVDRVQTALRNLAKTTFVNASEEAATQIGDDLAEAFLLADKSQLSEVWQQAYQGALAAGKSDTQAQSEANNQAAAWLAKDVGLAGLGGALMGAGFGVVGNARGVYNAQRAQGPAVDEPGPEMSEANFGSEPMHAIDGVQDRRPVWSEATNAARTVGRQGPRAVYEQTQANNALLDDAQTGEVQLGQGGGEEAQAWVEQQREQAVEQARQAAQQTRQTEQSEEREASGVDEPLFGTPDWMEWKARQQVRQGEQAGQEEQAQKEQAPEKQEPLVGTPDWMEERRAQYHLDELARESEQQRRERYARDKMEVVAARRGQSGELDLEGLRRLDYKQATKYLRPILEKFGIFGRHRNDALEIEFEYTKNGFSRSMAHQMKEGAPGYSEFALVQANLKEICEKAYPLEAHPDEKPKTADNHVQQVITLGSVLQTKDGGIIPVKMTVKLYDDGPTRLHMTIAEQKRKIADVKSIATQNAPHMPVKQSSAITITEFAELVKENPAFMKRLGQKEQSGQSSQSGMDAGKAEGKTTNQAEESAERQESGQEEAEAFDWLESYRQEEAAVDQYGRRRVSDESRQAAAQIAARYRRNVRFEALPGGVNGYFDGATGDIVLSSYLKEGKTALEVLKHELAHSTEGTDTYRQLRAFVEESETAKGWLQGKGFDGLGEYAQSLRDGYEALGVEMDAQGALHEAVANFVGEKLFASPKSVEELARGKRSLCQRVLDFIEDAIAAISGRTSEEAELRRVERMFLRALKESGAGQGMSYQNEGRQYEINPGFAGEIDAWDRQGRQNGARFVLGSTGDVLQGLGARENDIYMLGEKINKILGKHGGMTIEEIKQLPQILEHPIVILKSKNVGRAAEQNTRMVLFGSVKNQAGKPVACILDLLPSENRIQINDMQKLTSAYIKDRSPVQFFRDSDVMYVAENKKRTRNLLSGIGFKMPIACNQTGSLGSITYRGGTVNIQGVPFARVFREDGGPQYSMDLDSIEQRARQDKELKGQKVARSLGLSPLQDETTRRLAGEIQELTKDNERLKKQVGRLKEEFALTQGHHPAPGYVEQLAGQLRNKYESSYDKARLTEELTTLFETIANDKEVNFEQVSAEAAAIGRQLLEESGHLEPSLRQQDEHYEALYKTLSGTTPLTDKEYRAITAAFGKPAGGRILGLRVKKIERADRGPGAYLGLDDYNQKFLCENWPEFFREDMAEEEIFERMAEARRAVNERQFRNEYGFDLEEAALDVGQEIFEAYMRTPEKRTFADKQARKLAALRAEYSRERAEWRREKREAYRAGMEAGKQARQAQVERLKERQAEALKRQQARQAEQYGEQLERLRAAQSAWMKRRLAEFDTRVERQRQRMEKQLERQRAETKAAQERTRRAYDNTAKARLRDSIAKKARWFTAVVTHPDKGRHVPRDLMQLTAKVAEIVDTMEKEANPERNTQYWADLLDRVRRVQENPSYAVSQEWKESGVYGMIAELMDNLAEAGEYKTTGEMSRAQLQAVDQILGSIKHNLTEANKLIGREKGIEIRQAAQAVTREVRHSRGVPGAAARRANNLKIEFMNPRTFFNMLCGWVDGETARLHEELRQGQRRMIQIQMEFARHFGAVTGPRHKKELASFSGRQAKTVDVGLRGPGGERVEITHAQLCSLYMHLQSPQNRNHLENGGLSLPKPELYAKGQTQEAFAQAVRVEAQGGVEALLDRVSQAMNEYDRQWVELAEPFFDKLTKSYINQTSLQLLGYEKAKVDNYFPIVSDKNFVGKEFEAVMHDIGLENSGFLKERMARASSPLILEDINRVITRQGDNVARYAGLAIPVRNFTRVWNDHGGYDDSVHNAVAHKWGARAVDYVGDLLADLQGGRKQNSHSSITRGIQWVRSNYAQAVLTLNVRSALSQESSYPAAASVLGFKPVARAFGELLNVTAPGGRRRKLDELNAEMAQYSPMGWVRQKGSTGEIYDMNANPNWARRQMERLPGADKLLNWMGRMDENTIAALWQAAKYAAEEGGFERKSEAFWRETTRLFERALETQPNYTTMEQAEISRSKDPVQGFLSMFKTPQLAVHNQVMDAWGALQARREEWLAAGKPNGKTQEGQRALTGEEAGAEFSLEELAAEDMAQRRRRYGQDRMEVVQAKQGLDGELETEDLRCLNGAKAVKYLHPILEKFGVLGKYKNDALEIEIEYTSSGFRRSAYHQAKEGAPGYQEFALVQANLKELCEKAYPLEAHSDEKPKAADNHVTQVVTLGSVLQTKDGGLIPVKMTVKLFDNGPAKLHVVIAAQTKKASVIKAQVRATRSIRLTETNLEGPLPFRDVWTQEAHSTPGKEPSTVTITEFAELVKENPAFLKRLGGKELSLETEQRDPEPLFGTPDWMEWNGRQSENGHQSGAAHPDGESNENSRQSGAGAAYRAAQRQFARALGAALAGDLMYGILICLLANPLLHKFDDDRDETGELSWWETFLQVMDTTMNSFSTQVMPLMGGEIYDFVISRFAGEKFYGSIGNHGYDVLNDLMEDLEKLIDGEVTQKEVQKTLVDACTALGLPGVQVRNWWRMGTAYLEDAQNLLAGKPEELGMGGYTTTTANATAAAGQAIESLSGDKKRYSLANAQRVVDRWYNGWQERNPDKTASDGADSLRAALREKYKEEYLAADEETRQRMARILTGVTVNGLPVMDQEYLDKWVYEAQRDEVKPGLAQAVTDSYTGLALYGRMDEAQRESAGTLANKVAGELARLEIGAIGEEDMTQWIRRIYEGAGRDVNRAAAEYGEAVLVRAICNSAGNKKEEQIQALVAAGFSQGQAKTLREKYMGNK